MFLKFFQIKLLYKKKIKFGSLDVNRLMIIILVCLLHSEFLAPGATDPVNVDCRVAESVRKKVENSPDRNCFEEAEASHYSCSVILKPILRIDRPQCTQACANSTSNPEA